MATNIHVVGLDHIVLNVADVERSLVFYGQQLGLTPLRVAEWRAGDVPFPSVGIDATTIIDLFAATRAGENLNHFALVIASADLDALSRSGEFNVVEGPARRWGAQGYGTSLYISDPDGNVVELRTYGAKKPLTD
jgi:catechol 2,3-dioxygenase-like lactoylglutathione lyase family enzyme